MSLVVFAPARAGDEALVCTRWIAGQVAQRFVSDQYSVVALFEAGATRAALEAALAHGVGGLAAFSHGSPERIAAVDRVDPALDAQNIHSVQGCWVYALACETAQLLGQRAVGAGATLYAGYEVRVVVEFEINDLVGEVGEAFRALVVETPAALAEGIQDRPTIQSRLFRLVDHLLLAIDDLPEESAGRLVGMSMLAQQLQDRLVILTGSAPTPGG